MSVSTINIPSLTSDILFNLLGVNDINLSYLSRCNHKEINFNNHQFTLKNCDVKEIALIEKQINFLIYLAQSKLLTKQDILNVYELVINDYDIGFLDKFSQIHGYTASGIAVGPKTLGQVQLLDSFDHHTITFINGPAGSGKTYLSVLKAVDALKKQKYDKIILCRPAVDAGESLGFLPGDFKDKIEPYLMPLYDCLYEFLGKTKTDHLIETNKIEIIAFAYMRGRSLNNSIIILDEAQNTTLAQMKMFLTRLGYNSKMIICGDVTQGDLRDKKTESGFRIAMDILAKLDDINIITLTKKDIVRNPLITKIVAKFEEYNI